MPAIPSQTHQSADTDAEIFAEASERLRIAQEAEGLNRQYAVQDLEFEDGQQWPDDLYNLRKVTKRPTLTINHTRAMVKRVVNNLRQQRPRIKVHPVNETAAKDIAQKLQGLIRHIEYRSQEGVAYDLAGEFAVKMGWGYARVLSEYEDDMSFEQELKVLPIPNPFTVYMDPAARDCTGSDAEWCLISEKMKRSEYERKFPDREPMEWREGGRGDQGPDWETKEEIRLAEYFRFKRVKDDLLKLTDGRSMYASEYAKKRQALTLGGIGIATNLKGQEIRRPAERKQLQWFRLDGAQVIQSVDLPGKYIPVVRFEGNTLDINGQIRRRGMVRDLMDTNRMYNYWRTCETEVIALAPRAPYMGTANHFEGHPEWNDANQKSYGKLVYNPDTVVVGENGEMQQVPPPSRVEPVQIPAGFVQAAESALKDLMILAGMPHEPGQDAPGVVVSGKALRQRQALSDMGHFQYYDNQTRSIAQIGRILLDNIPHYYSEERMLRIIGDDGIAQMVKFNQKTVDKIKNDLTIGRYDVVMDTGPGYETRRQEEAETTVDLLKIGPLAETAVKAAPDLIFRNFGMDEIADRVAVMVPGGMEKAIEGLPQDAQNIVKGVLQQLTAAQNQVKELTLEKKYGLDKASIAANAKVHDTQVDAHVKEADSQRWAEVDIQKAHIDRQTKLDVAEIGAAKTLLDTHVKGKYAQEMEKTAAKDEKSNP